MCLFGHNIVPYLMGTLATNIAIRKSLVEGQINHFFTKYLFVIVHRAISNNSLLVLILVKKFLSKIDTYDIAFSVAMIRGRSWIKFVSREL